MHHIAHCGTIGFYSIFVKINITNKFKKITKKMVPFTTNISKNDKHSSIQICLNYRKI